ncbi:trans-1,2-dihydrobenzene-1,2-diol dehydrogenase-like [Argonauta hians]
MRWGICGVGANAEDFCKTLQTYGREDHTIVAIAGGTTDDAYDFSKKYQVPNTAGGWERLSRNPKIDIVFVSTLPADRYYVAHMMLENFKHVVTEAPCTMTSAEMESLMNTAKQNRRYLLESLTMPFLPVFKAVRDCIDNGDIGEVKYLDAAVFGTILTGENNTSTGVTGGCFANSGVYLMWLAYYVFGRQPDHIMIDGDYTLKGIDQGCNIILIYGNQRAVLSCHSEFSGRNDAWISGTVGTIHIHPPFWVSNKFTMHGIETDYPPLSEAKVEDFHYQKSTLLLPIVHYVHNDVMSNSTESSLHPLAETLEVNRLTEKVRTKLYKVRHRRSHRKSQDELDFDETFFDRIGCTLL